MTKEEAISLSAYTGFLLVPDFSDVHKFCEDTLGRPILTHEFGDQDVQKEIQDKLRSQIMELIQNISALRPVTREQVEKVWRGEWIGIPNMGVYDIACSKCGYSTGIRFWSSDFCPNCGAPLTDEAVDMVMERINKMEETGDGLG